MAETRKAYRNTRTDAVRLSSKVLGYPFVPATDAPAEADTKATDAKAKGAKANGGDAKTADG